MDKNVYILKESINRAVKEILFENKKNETVLDTIIENVVSNKLRMLKEDNNKENRKSGKDVKNKKHNVLQWLRQDTVNVAAIRRELEGEPETQEEEDSKRSYFMKKVHETDGKSFSDNEINALYAIKSRLGQ